MTPLPPPGFDPRPPMSDRLTTIALAALLVAGLLACAASAVAWSRLLGHL